MDRIALIPAYNEEKTIGEAVKRLAKISIPSLVVDDGSKDKTEVFAKTAGSIVVKHEKNKGKGESIKTGFDFILKSLKEVEYVVLLDADLQCLPEEASRVLDPLIKKRADFVMGFRNWKSVPFRHRLGNSVWKFFFNFLFRTKLKDTNCGYMALTREAIKQIKNIHGGYIIENHILSQIVKKGLRIEQVPVNIVYINKSKVKRGLRMVFGVLWFIIKEGVKYELERF